MCCLFLALGCGATDEAAGAEYMDEPFPPWSCDTDEMSGTGQPCGTSGGTPAPTCEGTLECGADVCAASFNGDIGPFECQSSCIEPMDDYRWCFDADACCDAEAICDRGYCIGPDVIETTTGLETTGASDSTSETTGTESGSTGTGTDATTDTGTDSSGGSSDGA